MTAPEKLVNEASRRGLRIEPHSDGQHIIVEPTQILNCDPDFRETLRANKLAIIAWLYERTALHTAKQILCGEFDGNREHLQTLASMMRQCNHPLCQAAYERVATLKR